MNKEDCIFCKVVLNEVPSWKIYEDDSFLAFLDQTQAKDGHTLVIPKSHHENLFDTPDKLLGQMAIRIKSIATRVKLAMKSDGIPILQCNGVAGL